MNVAIFSVLLSQIAAVGVMDQAPVVSRLEAPVRSEYLVAAAESAPAPSATSSDKTAPVESLGGTTCTSTIISMFPFIDASSSKVIDVRDCWWILEQVGGNTGSWSKPQD